MAKIVFKDSELQSLYTDAKCNDKFYNSLQPGIKKKFIKVVKYLEQINTLAELTSLHSLNYEKMQQMDNEESVKINDQYRLILHVTFEDDKIVVQIDLIKISKHYGDN